MTDNIKEFYCNDTNVEMFRVFIVNAFLLVLKWFTACINHIKGKTAAFDGKDKSNKK